MAHKPMILVSGGSYCPHYGTLFCSQPKVGRYLFLSNQPAGSKKLMSAQSTYTHCTVASYKSTLRRQIGDDDDTGEARKDFTQESRLEQGHEIICTLQCFVFISKCIFPSLYISLVFSHFIFIFVCFLLPPREKICGNTHVTLKRR